MDLAEVEPELHVGTNTGERLLGSREVLREAGNQRLEIGEPDRLG